MEIYEPGPPNQPWPDDWPAYYHTHAGEPCDMLVGPCSCGAWHNVGEFEMREDGLYRFGGWVK